MDDPGIEFKDTPWLLSLNWDASEPILLGIEEKGGFHAISWSVKDPTLGIRYTLTFLVDNSNAKLITITRTKEYGSGDSVYESTSVAFDIRLNQADIGAVIEQQYQETQLQVIE